jgi:hypothetical protein
MTTATPTFVFPDATEYAFVFHNAHLLLMTYARDDAKFLFLIDGEDEGSFRLTYPGRAFTDRVLDTIESIFFVAVEEEGQEPTRYILGSLFDAGGRTFGAYYERDNAEANVVLFEASGEAPAFELSVPDDDAYEEASRVFADEHEGLLHVKR